MLRDKTVIRFAFVALVIIAIYGAVMRYKIAFDFPFLSQKNLQNAHSHFAFAAWISHLLYFLGIREMRKYLSIKRISKYYTLLLVNMIASVGMLASFTYAGYNVISIIIATITILIAYLFLAFFLIDKKMLPSQHPMRTWYSAALVWGAVSSIGTFYLAYMYAQKISNFDHHLGSLYFFLHFQYNGWFMFAIIGTALTYFFHKNIFFDRRLFTVFAVTCVPNFFLSILWAKLPTWLYIFAVIAIVFNAIAWFILFRKMIGRSKKISNELPSFGRLLILGSFLALSIKYVLQLVSTYPGLSDLVYGFRPIVIVYLHLVFLGVVTIYLLGYLYSDGIINNSKALRNSISIFIVGIILNELVLMIQGFAAFFYIPIPYANEALFVVALILLLGAFAVFASHKTNVDIDIINR